MRRLEVLSLDYVYWVQCWSRISLFLIPFTIAIFQYCRSQLEMIKQMNARVAFSTISDE